MDVGGVVTPLEVVEDPNISGEKPSFEVHYIHKIRPKNL